MLFNACILEEAGDFAVLYDRLLGKRIVITKDGGRVLQLLEKNRKDKAIEFLAKQYNEPVDITSKKVEIFLKELRDTLSVSKEIMIRNFDEEDIILFSDMTYESSSDIVSLKRAQSLQSESFFVADLNMRPIGIIGCPIYEPVGRIGWLYVMRDARYRGIGSYLVKHAINFFEKKKVKTILLNASSSGINLFRKFNFIQIGSIACMIKEGQTDNKKLCMQEVTNSAIDEICNYDYHCTGINRQYLLQAILRDPETNVFIKRNKSGIIAGYLVLQKDLIGPWISEKEIAYDLLKTALSNVPIKRNIKIFTPYANYYIRALLKDQGFEEFSCCTMMCRGEYEFDNKNICAIASLADG